MTTALVENLSLMFWLRHKNARGIYDVCTSYYEVIDVGFGITDYLQQ